MPTKSTGSSYSEKRRDNIEKMSATERKRGVESNKGEIRSISSTRWRGLMILIMIEQVIWQSLRWWQRRSRRCCLQWLRRLKSCKTWIINRSSREALSWVMAHQTLHSEASPLALTKLHPDNRKLICHNRCRVYKYPQKTFSKTWLNKQNENLKEESQNDSYPTSN